MKNKSFLCVAVISLLGIAACAPSASHDELEITLVESEFTIQEQITAATCATRGSAVNRDRWLGEDMPSWVAVLTAHEEHADNPITQSGVSMAYAAYLESGKDHAIASVIFDTRYENWRGKYPQHAICWVQYQ